MRKLVMEYSEWLTNYLQYLGKKMYSDIVLNAVRGGMDGGAFGLISQAVTTRTIYAKKREPE